MPTSIKPAVITDLLRVHEYDYLLHIQVRAASTDIVSSDNTLASVKFFCCVALQIFSFFFCVVVFCRDDLAPGQLEPQCAV